VRQSRAGFAKDRHAWQVSPHDPARNTVAFGNGCARGLKLAEVNRTVKIRRHNRSQLLTTEQAVAGKTERRDRHGLTRQCFQCWWLDWLGRQRPWW
jgi:hypothetical protein